MPNDTSTIPIGVYFPFSWVPLIGSTLATLRDRRILINRSEDFVATLWDAAEIDYSFVQRISKTIADGGGWTSCLFVPADNATALIYPYGDPGLESVTILTAISEIVSDCEIDDLADYLNSGQDRSLLDLVIRVNPTACYQKKPSNG